MNQDDENQKNPEGRKFIGVKFDCCGAYARVYHNAQHNAYMGRCPRCLKAIKVQVDPSRATTSNRFFKAK